MSNAKPKSRGSTRSSQKQGDTKNGRHRPTSNTTRGADIPAQKSESELLDTPLATGASSAPPLVDDASLLETRESISQLHGAEKSEVRGDGKESDSKHEEAARRQLRNKDIETLQEELQTKNQQVKQYKKQVDAVKAELDKCREDLKRLQEQRDEGVEQLRKEKEDIEEAIKVVYQDADTQLSERDLKWQELFARTKEEGKHIQRQNRETYKKFYVQKYSKWCQTLLSDDQEGVELPVGTGEEAALLEVIREYRERTREKMRAMEERYQHDLIAREEGSNKKQLQQPGMCIGDSQSSVEERAKEVEAMCQHRMEELTRKHEAVIQEKEQMYHIRLEKVKNYYRHKYEEKFQRRGLGDKPESGSSGTGSSGTPEDVTRLMEEKRDGDGDYRRSLKELQREHGKALREKMEAHLMELDEVKERYRKKYEALVTRSSRNVSQNSERQSSSEGGRTEALCQRVSELSKQLQDKEAMVAKITEDYKQQEKELMTHVENQSRAIVELKSSVASSEDVIKQLMEQLEALRREKSQVEQRTILLEREVQGAKSRGAQALQREVERLKVENSSQADTLKAMSQEKANLEGELELIRAQAQTFKEDFLQERKDRESAHTTISKMEAEWAGKREGLIAELQRARSLGGSRELGEELEARKGQVEQLQGQVEVYKDELEKCRSELERMRSEHQVPMPSPEDSVQRDPQAVASRGSVHQSLLTGATPHSDHHRGDDVRPQSRHRSNSPGSIRQFGLEPQQGIGASQPPHQKQLPGGHPMIMAPLLPLRVDSSHLRASSSHERVPQAVSVSVLAGRASEIDLSAHIETEIHRQVANVAGSNVSQFDTNTPLDPNLTCPKCRNMFRKGEIQNYKRHVASCSATP